MKNNFIKLNLGCGKDIKKGFLNIDSFEHKNFKLDIKTNLTRKIPIESNIVNFVYSSHFLEHLDWIAGENFLKEVLRVLKKGGKLRILVPDYQKIFKNYVKKDKKFFLSIKKHLNNCDYEYYKKVLEDKTKVKKERLLNPPPGWHFSKKPAHIYQVKLRKRYFSSLLQIVNWFTHQHGEHKTLYDFETLNLIMKKIGFKKIQKTSYQLKIDAKSSIRKKISLCVEAYK